MPLRPTLRLLTLCLLILSTTAAAQLPPTGKQESAEEKEKARKELERKALVLLDETLEGAQVLKLAENRAALRMQAADLLWTRDEKRARALFRDAATELAALKRGDAGRSGRDYWIATQMRSQFLAAVAKHDPKRRQFTRETQRPGLIACVLQAGPLCLFGELFFS